MNKLIRLACGAALAGALALAAAAPATAADVPPSGRYDAVQVVAISHFLCLTRLTLVDTFDGFGRIWEGRLTWAASSRRWTLSLGVGIL